MVLKGWRRKVNIGLISLLTSISCVPSSEIERTIQAVTEQGSQNTGAPFIPNYPPYVQEDITPGNGRYPKSIVEWDDVENPEHLVNGKCSDNGYTTVKNSIGPNAVTNGFIVRFDHDIAGKDGKDLALHLTGEYPPISPSQGSSFYIGVYSVIPKDIYFKRRNNKAIELPGWDKYDFYLIYELNGTPNGRVIQLDVEQTVKDAGRSSPYIAFMSYSLVDVNVRCLIDLHGD